MTAPRVSLGVAVVAFAVYANNLGNEFAMDDGYNVVENASIRCLGNIPSQFTRAWGATAGDDYSQAINVSYWRPMVSASYTVDHAIWGLRPFGFHLTNNLLHALVSGLVALLLFRLVGGAGALAGGLLFALHPVHTEAVNLVSYRTELMAALFSVLALLAHQRSSAETRWRSVLLVSLLYGLGLASKETAVTLPGWLFMLDLAALSDAGGQPRRAWIRRFAATYLPLCAVLLGYMVLRNTLLSESAINFYAGVEGPLLFMSVMKLYLYDLHLLLLPWPLTPFYDWTIVGAADSLFDPEAVTGLVVFAATIALAAFAWRRARPAGIGLCWWLLGLIPFMHIVPIPVGLAERFLYFPSVGIALVVAAAASRVPRNRAALAVGVALCALMALGTVVRNQAWRSDETLLRQAASDFPGSFNAHFGLGGLYYGQQRFAEAAESFLAADEILPDFAPNVAKLAQALHADGRQAEAIAAIDRALRARGPDAQLIEIRRALLTPGAL